MGRRPLLRHLRQAWLPMLALCAAASAHALRIDVATTSLGGGLYRQDYVLTNDGSLGTGVAVSLLDLLFDPLLVDEASLADLSSASLAASWTTQLLASAPGVDAAFDIQATGTGLADGTSLGGFALQFRWLGTGAPGAQRFEVYDPQGFELLEQGLTSPVPEPGRSGLLLAPIALACVAARRWPGRRPATLR